MKKTPLYDRHVEQGGKLIDFGGWSLPVEYKGIIPEHEAVRQAAGLFDVSHMGEVTVKGPGAFDFVQKIVTNDISTMTDRQIYYSPVCYDDGGTVDDLLVYRYDPEFYFLVINASNVDKDVAWFQEHANGPVEVRDVSEAYAELALQGPKAEAILQKLTLTDLSAMAFFHFLPEVRFGSIPALVSRTGYTGEDGFEIYISPADAPLLWDKIMEAGAEEGLLPAGLGARDTLRFEACLPLYGHEIDRTISPLEGDLGYFVKLDKAGGFIGRDALAAQKQNGLARKVCCFEMTGRGIARSGFPVLAGGREIGHVTTGSYSPTLKKNIGMALIEIDKTAVGTPLTIMIRDREVEAVVVPRPFYKKRYKKD